MKCSRLASAIALTAACTAALAQPKSDWEIQQETRDWKESEVPMPAYPRPENLIEFEDVSNTSFKFFVDGQSLIAGSDGAIRYTLVARSRSGVENVSFNGLRCKTSAHKVYAIGRADKTWVPTANGEWKELQKKPSVRPHMVLMHDFFCPSGVPIMSKDEGIQALRQGIHPYAVSYQPGMGKR